MHLFNRLEKRDKRIKNYFYGFFTHTCYIAREAADKALKQSGWGKTFAFGWFKWFKRARVILLLLSLFVTVLGYAENPNQNLTLQKFDVDIPATDAAKALNKLAQQTDTLLLFPYKAAKARQTNAVTGRYSLMDALDVLLEGSGLCGGLSENGAIKISLVENGRLTCRSKSEESETMNTSRNLFAAALTFLISSGGAFEQALADEEIDGNVGFGLEEVIVTARKRAENMQNVPISVTAFSAEKMEMQSMANLRDVARFAPGLVVSNTGGSPNQAAIYIRGIGEPEQFTTADPAVGVYVDGVYHGRAQGSVMDLVDLERIEVLRGPQGTLFGRNAIGGAVNLVSVAPNEENMTRLMLTYGNHERIEIGGSVNAPLIEDKLFVRATVKHTDRDCLAKTVNRGGCLGGIDTDAARIGLRWLATEDMTLDFTADYTNDNGYLMPNSLIFADPAEPITAFYNDLVASGALGPDAVPFTGNEPAAGDDPYITESTSTTEAPLDVFGLSAKLSWAINENLDLIAIGAYRELEQSYSFDVDKTRADIQTVVTDTEASQFSQEVRLEGLSFNDRLEWIAGLYYFEESSEYLERAFGGLNFLQGVAGDISRTPEQDTESIAAFGHFTYSLTDSLDLSGGLRYNRDKKDIHFLYSDLTVSPVNVLLDHRDSESWTEFSPKIGLDYQLADDLLLYASVSRGYRNGGFNGRALSLAETIPYNPETLTSYEIGIKSQLFDNKLRFNASVYFSDYKDRQVLFFQIDPDTSGSAQVVVNAAAAEVKGFEMEMTLLATDNLSLEANIGHMNAEITDSDPGSSITEDSIYTYAPEWTVALAADYRVPVETGEFRFRVDYNYRDRVNFFPRTPGVDDAFTFQNGFGLWNARFVYTSEDDKWNIALWGRNLTDEIYCLQCVGIDGVLGFAVGDFTEGREYGLTFTRNFL